MTRLNTPLPPVPSAEPSGDGDTALLSYRRAARRLGCSERTLWGLVKNGKIPAVKFGGLVRIDPTDLAEFIRQAKNGQVKPANGEQGAKALAAALAKLTPTQREKAERLIADHKAKAAQTAILG